MPILRPIHVSRRVALTALVGSALLVGIAPPPSLAAETLRVGYQRSSTLITLLKADQELEKALEAEGVSVTWHEFTSGLPLLEALNVGNVDFSADVADTVPLFAQAAGAKLAYVAEEAPSPTAQAILVPEKSEITAVEQLKGKKVAVTKGAGSHYLLIAALAKAGLSAKDVTPAYLTPADGRAAFATGSVDAYVTWDPFLASAQMQAGGRVLADGAGLANYKRYYLTTEAYAKSHARTLEILFAKLRAKGEWVKANPKLAAERLAALWKIDAAIVETGNGRRSYKVGAVTRDGLSEQQKIADVFFAEKLLPRQVDASQAAIWQPASQ